MKKFLLGILGVTLVFGLMLAGCEGGTAEPLSSDATLKSITVNGVAATLGTPNSDWMLVGSGLVGLSDDKLVDAPVKVTATDDKAIVYYYKGTFDDTPDFVAESTFTFAYGDCLYLRVFSANHDAEQFYQIAIIPDTAAITKVTVAGIEASLARPATSWIETVAGSVNLPVTKFTNAEIVVEGGVGLQYAKTKSAVEPSDFSSTGTLSFASDDILAIRVGTAEPYYYYQISLVNTTPTITDITLGGRSASGGSQLSGIPIPQFGNGVGSPGVEWDDTGIVPGEVWYGTSQEGTALPLTVIKELSTTTWKAAVAPEGTEPTFGTVTSITPINGQYLYLETASPDGGLSYYKIKLTAKDDSRALTSVTINDTNMDIGALGTHSFPGSEAYGTYSNGAELATTGNQSTYTATSLSDLKPLAVVVTAASERTTVTYGHTETERDYLIDFGASGSFNVKAFEYIALEVTSELGEKGWYKFYVPMSASVVSSLAVGSVSGVTPAAMTVTPGTFGVTISGTPAMVLVPPAEMGQSITLSATPATGFEGATVEYGFMTSGWTGPALPTTWQASGTFGTGIPDGTNVMLRVTDADNLAGVRYYAILVVQDGPPTVSTVTIGAVGNSSSFSYDPLVTVPNIGTPSDTIDNAVAGAVTLEANQTTGPIRATAGSGITVTFAKTTGAAPTDGDFVETSAGMYFPPYFETPPAPDYTFANGDVIWVKAVRDESTNYYKIVVTVE